MVAAAFHAEAAAKLLGSEAVAIKAATPEGPALGERWRLASSSYVEASPPRGCVLTWVSAMTNKDAN
jgi:hypothetical protein